MDDSAKRWTDVIVKGAIAITALTAFIAAWKRL
jgi:hypothetical protein